MQTSVINRIREGLLGKKETLEQWQVALERGLVQPIASVGPASVIDHHRKMGVEDQ